MYTTARSYYRYGNEEDMIDCTFLEWETLEKAIKYCERYSVGIRFAGVTVRDEEGNVVYELTACQDVYINGELLELEYEDAE